MWQIIRDLAAGGVTIFLTTQYLDEADQLADRIAVLDHGRIVADGSPEELKRRIPGGHIQLQFADPRDLESAAEALGAASRDDEALTLQVPSDGSLRSLRAMLDRLDYAGDRGRQPVDPHPRPRRRLLRPHRPPQHRERSPAMSTLSLAVTDSATMLRRSLRHMQRYPSLTLLILGMPVIFLLLFVYVFGGTLGAGLGGVADSRAVYVNYVTPGIILLTVATAAQATAISVAMDMTEGIIARFRTMAIARSSVLTGHVLGSLIQSMLSVAVVIGVAAAIGFRPTATLAEWVAAIGVIAMISFALIWLSVALGLVSKSVETASNLPMFLLLLPFLGSGFVPTDSMPAGVRWFAEYQPFTPVIETVRGLLLGTPIGHNAIIAVAWCAGIALLGYLWARRLYIRHPVR